MMATTAERVTFKMAVDRLTPYRFLLVEIIFITSTIIYSLITFAKRGFTNQITHQMRDFPHSKLIIMALLDTLQFAGLVVSAAGVTPTMTVILLHASTPFLVLGSRYTFPDRKYSEVQMLGVKFISVAIIISVIRQFVYIYTKTDFTGATSSLVYVLSAALQGFATLYKEKAIIEWSRPMDIHFLSSWLFFYQALVALILAPAIYLLQGVSSSWEGFPITSIFDNIRDGMTCFRGSNPSFQSYGNRDDDDSSYDKSFAFCSNR